MFWGLLVRKHLAPRRSATICFALLFAVQVCTCSSAATFTVPLEFRAETSDEGEYFVADFDLLNEFHSIDSVSLSLSMPEGFEGFHYSTGNSSSLSYLSFAIGNDTPEFSGFSIPSTSGIGTYILNVQPNNSRSFALYASDSLSSSSGPDFLADGIGTIGISRVTVGYSHPLPTGNPSSSSKTLGLPGPIENATLTIVGTVVPEPSAVATAIGLLALAGSVRYMR